MAGDGDGESPRVPFSPPSASLQERQRLETILNLCAEYNRGEGGDLEPPGLRAGFPGLQKQRESEEENLKEECSSTESTHQEVRTPPPLHGDAQVCALAPPPSPVSTRSNTSAPPTSEPLAFST